MRCARLAVFVTAVLATGAVVWPPPAAGSDDAPPASSQPAAWASKPPEQWPQLVLTNAATFAGHTPMDGASSFLVTLPDGQVYLGTAKHLIKEAGGVDPPVPIGELDASLKQWTAYPRTEPESVVRAKGLAVTANHEVGHDWLLLKLTDPTAKLPATPLTPRLTPAVVGETIYLVGVPYTDRTSPQCVYKGRVTARPLDHYFTYDFTPAVPISGFSGAPIVDANGLLVGHGVSRSEFKEAEDGTQTAFGGEDADYGVRLWKHRDDPPGEKAVAALTLPLPDGWTVKQVEHKGVLRTAVCTDPPCEFQVVARPKTDFDDDVDLMARARTVRGFAAKSSKLANRRETEPVEAKVGDRTTVQYDFTGTLKGTDLHYRLFFIEVGGCFCEVWCWSTPANWDAAQPRFEQVVKDLK